jgi:hypothetical protein
MTSHHGGIFPVHEAVAATFENKHRDEETDDQS